MNPLAPILVSILLAVARYYTLTRIQLDSLCAPGKSDSGRRMRKHLTALRHAGLINQTNGRVVFPERNGAPAPVYYPSRKGCELLAELLKDECYLHVCTLTPNWQHLYHWVRIADLRILFDRAVALQTEVQMCHWLTEWTIANPEERSPEKRYSLFTLLQETPRLVCAADACCVLSYRGYLKGVYFEIDRATSGINQIANSKTPGYAKMAETRTHARHFPGVAAEIPFTVLHVSPSAARRDLVAKAIKGKPGEKLWKFASWDELRPETALHEEIIRDVDLKALPLVRRLGGTKE
jgi:hypothetical protein